jgi:hypothetical protein
MPAEAGIQVHCGFRTKKAWIPAFAGMTIYGRTPVGIHNPYGSLMALVSSRSFSGPHKSSS